MRNKTNIVMQGRGYQNTSMESNDTSKSAGGTAYSFSFDVLATNFTAYNISFKVRKSKSQHMNKMI